jgi:hypothetical protein
MAEVWALPFMTPVIFFSFRYRKNLLIDFGNKVLSKTQPNEERKNLEEKKIMKSFWTSFRGSDVKMSTV